MLRDCGVRGRPGRRADSPGSRRPPRAADPGRAGGPGRAGAPARSPRPATREALAALVHTAGTTGDPKPVMLTHRALLAHAEHTAALDVVGPETAVLAMLPLFGVFGLNAVLGGWLAVGRPAGGHGRLRRVLRRGARRAGHQPARSPRRLLARILADERCATHLTSVTTVICGAARAAGGPAGGVHRADRLRVEQGYGLTEAAPGVSATVGGRVLGHGHVGRPLPGVEVRIGNGSDGDEPGEIAIRGANLFSGYWPDGAGGPDADGWFATGDIGYLRDGELFLVDRTRELIIVNGFHGLSGRGRGGDPRAARGGVGGRARPRRTRVRGRAGGRVRHRPGADRRWSRRTARAGWPGSSARPPSPSSTSCPAARPARCRRAGCGAHSLPTEVGRSVTRAGSLVLTRQGCHLCDQAIEVVAAVCAETGEAYATRDIDADPELRRTVHRPGAGHLRRRRPARLLAGRPGPAARGAGPAAPGPGP